MKNTVAARECAVHLQVSPFVTHTEAGIQIAVITARPAPERILLRAEPNNEEWLVEMTSHQASDKVWWCAVLPENPASGRNFYCFKLLYSDHQQWLHADGVTTTPPRRASQFRLQLKDAPPEWMQAQVFYQIFPDRFCNGDDRLSVKNDEYCYNSTGRNVYRKQWDQPLETHDASNVFYGGDLPGISSKLGYLQALGITALSLNPIFTSPSNHKYNVEDYQQVDPHLGGNQAFLELCLASRDRGMRLMLDAVVNHTGDSHPWFNRWSQYPTTGAYQSPDSLFSDHYLFSDQENRDSYVDWKGHRVLPVLDYASERLKQRIFGSSDGALCSWLKPPYLIDGWRIDVAQMIGEGKGAANNLEILKQMRDAVKTQNPDALFLGEHWGDAAEWLQGGVEDCCMNYFGFTLPVWAFVAGRDVAQHPVSIDANDFADWLDKARCGISLQHQLSQLNLLSSADTPRFFTLCNGDINKLRMAVLLLFTYPGVPCVFYGDEIGLHGGDSPLCRATFPWEQHKWNQQVLAIYRQGITLRKEFAALQRGAYLRLRAEGELFVFARLLDDQLLITALNRSTKDKQETVLDLAALAPDSSATELLSGGSADIEQGKMQLHLAPQQVQIWHCHCALAQQCPLQ